MKPSIFNYLFCFFLGGSLSASFCGFASSKDTMFKQLIDITAIDYPQNEKRFKLVYLLLSHEFNQRIHIDYNITEKEIANSIFLNLFPKLDAKLEPMPM